MSLGSSDVITYVSENDDVISDFSFFDFAGEITVDNNVDRESTAVFKLTVRAGKAKCDESDKNDTGIPTLLLSLLSLPSSLPNCNIMDMLLSGIEGGGTDVLSSASAVVNIYVEDVNDNAPRFTNPSYEYDFKDIKTTELFTITATDDDLGLGGVVKYRLAGQTEVSSYLSAQMLLK